MLAYAGLTNRFFNPYNNTNMADLKVSQLPVVNTAGATDKIIINAGFPQETKTITVKNFLATSGFSPIHVVIPGAYTSVDITRVSGESFGDFANVFENTAPVPVQMPSGADRAVVIYNGKVAMLSRVGVTGESNSFLTYKLQLQQTGGNFQGNDVNHINMSGGVHMPHPTTNSGDPNIDFVGKFTAVAYPVKSSVVSFSELATVNFTPKCAVIKAKQGVVNILPGRLIILPFNSSNSTASALASTFVAIDDEFDYPSLTLAEEETDKSKDLKNRMLFLINAIDETLRYDAQFDTQFPASTDTGVPGGTGTNGNMTPRELLQATAEGVMAIKRNPSLDYDAMGTELDSLENQAAPYVAFKFDWQVNSFASFF